MLPNSHAWKMLCRLYGLLLKEEWARRLAERCAFPVFLSSASKVREIWTNLLRRPASIDACLLRCGCGGRVAGRAGLIDMLERRVMLSGDTLQTATPLIFQETPAAPGYSWAYVSDSIDLATDVDYWAIDVFANDGISLMVESQTGLNAHLELRNSADGVLRSDADSGPGTDPMIVDYVAPTTGRIYARVSGAGLGDYTLRVDRGRAFALESDAAYSNNTLANANPLELRASGVNTVAQVAGVVMASEGSTADVDTYLIGYLKTGSTVTLTLNYPDGST